MQVMNKIARPSETDINLIWRDTRWDKTVSLWVEAWIPDDRTNIDPRSADVWKAIRRTDKEGNTAPGFAAVTGPIIGKGSRLMVFDTASKTNKEDIHPSWVYSIETREASA